MENALIILAVVITIIIAVFIVRLRKKAADEANQDEPTLVEQSEAAAPYKIEPPVPVLGASESSVTEPDRKVIFISVGENAPKPVAFTANDVIALSGVVETRTAPQGLVDVMGDPVAPNFAEATQILNAEKMVATTKLADAIAEVSVKTEAAAVVKKPRKTPKSFQSQNLYLLQWQHR